MKKNSTFRKPICIIAAVLLMGTGLISCSNSGGGGSPPAGAAISGKVIDGYVRGAAVYVYSDEAMTDQVGAGTSGNDGSFSFNLAVEEIPNPVYIKTEGGIDIATGMPAPTMFFKGAGDRDSFNITPLTDALWKYGRTEIDAEAYLQARLELVSTSELYEDPLDAGASSALQAAHSAALASGTQTGTLPDGNYAVVVVYLEEGDLTTNSPGHGYSSIGDVLTHNRLEFPVTISGGAVTGTVDGAGITGRVSGGSIMMTIMDQGPPAAVTRVAGTIGLLGSVSGNYTRLIEPEGVTPSLPDKGFFVASFIPAGGGDVAGLAALAAELFAGPRNFVFRDLIGDAKEIGSGMLTVDTIDFAAGTFQAVMSNLHLDGRADPTIGAGDHPSAEGVFLKTAGTGTIPAGLPTSITLMRFETDLTGEGFAHPSNGFIIQAIGNRRGIYMDVDFENAPGNEAFNIGEFYSAKLGGLSPIPAPGTYSAKVAVAHPGLLGNPRDVDAMLVTITGIQIPDVSATGNSGRTGAVNETGGLVEVNGSILAFKYAACVDSGTGCGMGDPDDGYFELQDQTHFVRMVELYEGGAMQGEQIVGGTIDLDGRSISLAAWPATFVGFLGAGGTAPIFNGTLKFMSRDLYYSKHADYADPETQGYSTGTITISGASASLVVDGVATAEMTVTNHGGLYHMHGTMTGEIGGEAFEDHTDVFWPVGGTKAVYIGSNVVDGVHVVGEAFLTP